MAGRVFVTSGLGGMSGAQAKAAVICGCVGVVAEVREYYPIMSTHVFIDKLLPIIQIIKLSGEQGGCSEETQARLVDGMD